ncbi:hypothetical protein ACQKNX_22770 [Lysinibacillus sp. NPDC093712]|uniref:hypothetical protein n=1 Tax=Lysinibacillus sp. NPDC093712 TaxID=3390579 RepID=UPI003CFD1DDF
MGIQTNENLVIAREDELKGSELKSIVLSEHIKDQNGIVMKEEDSKEYENLFNALNITVTKI